MKLLPSQYLGKGWTQGALHETKIIHRLIR